jgi:hypothetical protein
MKYTPGPWRLIDSRQIAKSDGGVIATAWWFGNKGTVPKAEAEANAHLIAAAPEMYECLKIFRDNIHPITNNVSLLFIEDSVVKGLDRLIKKFEKPEKVKN